MNIFLFIENEIKFYSFPTHKNNEYCYNKWENSKRSFVLGVAVAADKVLFVTGQQLTSNISLILQLFIASALSGAVCRLCWSAPMMFVNTLSLSLHPKAFCLGANVMNLYSLIDSEGSTPKEKTKPITGAYSMWCDWSDFVEHAGNILTNHLIGW